MPRPTARPGALSRALRLVVISALLLMTVGVIPVRAATLGQFPTSNTFVAGAWTTPSNAYADDGNFAWITLGRGGTATRSYGGFGFDSIPAGSTITSATLEIQFNVTNNGGVDTVTAQAYVSGSPSGTAATDSSSPTTDTIISTTNLGITSRSQLLDGTFTVRVSDQRAASGGPTAKTFNLDYVKVTVVYAAPDTTAPVVTVPADMTEEATGPTGATVSFTATATDLVDGPLTPACTPASGSTFALGATTVTCEATDAAGNTGSASFTVTVVDTTDPVVTVPADITVPATGPSGAAVTFSASATDLVDGSLTPVCTPASGSTFPVGATSVTCEATDAAGNTGSATFSVTVIALLDTTDPVVTVPADMTEEATGPTGATVSFTATATDLVDGPLTPACTPASGSTFALGATTVTCEATDAAGNTGSASFTVTVVDTTDPVVTVPADITVPATGPSGAAVTFSASATDLVDGSLTPVCTPASGSTFPVGATSVTCEATDAAGNTGSATFSVTVEPYVAPDQPPVLDPIGNQTVAEGAILDVPLSATDPDGDIITFVPATLPAFATLTDHGDGTATLRLAPGYTDAGDYLAQQIAVSAGVGFDSEIFDIEVTNTDQPPVLDPIGNQTVAEGASTTVTLTATDPDGDTITYFDAALPAFAVLTDNGDGTADLVLTPGFTDAGTYPVTIGVTAGLGFDSETFDIVVTDTNQPPVLDPIGDQTVAYGTTRIVAISATDADGDALEFGQTGLPAFANLTDNGDGTATLTITPGPGDGGTYPVTVGVTDQVDSDDETFDIIVVPDTTPPVVTVPADMTREATGPAGATVTFIAFGTDDIDGDLNAVCAPASGSTFALGTTTVNCQATDVSGNTGSASFTITVVDTTAPAVTVPADITREATGSTGATVNFVASATDLVDGSVTPTCTPASGSTFALGDTTVTCTATDNAGNTGAASFTIIVEDTTAPVVGGPNGGTLPNLTIDPTSAAGAIVTFTVGATDTVDGPLTPACQPPSGSQFPVGTTTVTCSVTDSAGNTGRTSFTVTVAPYQVATPSTPPTSAGDSARINTVNTLPLAAIAVLGAVSLLLLVFATDRRRSAR